MYRKWIAIALCLMLLPSFAFSEGFNYTLSFSSAKGAPDSVMEGILDLLDMLDISGTFLSNSVPGEGFELEANVLLDKDERTRLDFYIYGVPAMFHIVSSLWNQEDIMINAPAMLEYSMKIYNHMDIPLQRIALLYPFVTYDALEPVWNEIEWYMRNEGTQEETVGTWQVSPDTVQRLAEKLQDMTYSNRSFRIWLETLASINAYGEKISDLFTQLPAYVSAQDSSITVQTEENGRSWSIASTDAILLRETTYEDGTYVFTVSLPGFVDGTDLLVDVSSRKANNKTNIHITFSIGEGEHALLAGGISTSALPASLMVSDPFEINVQLQGPLLESIAWFQVTENGEIDGHSLTDNLTFRIEGDRDSIRVMDGDTAVLTMHTALEALENYEEPFHSVYDFSGLNFFSLYDTTLRDFVSEIRDSVLEKAIPLIVHAPVTTVVSLMDILQDGGVLDLLAGGLGDSFDPDEDYVDDEDWWDEYDEDYDSVYDEDVEW